MNAEIRDSAFPQSVQPGIPRLGRLPDGWTKAPLKRFLREVRRPLKMDDDTEYRLVTVKRSRGGVIERSVLSGRDISVKSQFYVRSGDFLISKRQIVHGACGLVPDDLDGSVVSNEYAVLNGTSEIDLQFLSYLSHSRFFQQSCFHSSIGVHVEKMIFKLDRWLSWDFHLPPLPEQQKIAEILSTWDKAIETTQALLANARTQKRALMQSLLTCTRRFPGFEGQAWREVLLREVCEVDRNSLGSKTPDDHEFEYISLSNVEPGHIVEPLARLTFGEAPSRARRLVDEGDILMSTVRPNLQGFAPITSRFAECVASTGFAVVSPGAQIDGSYFFHYLFSDQMTAQLDALVVGSNYPAINSSDVKQLKIRLPVLEEQKQIGAILDDCDQDIRQLEKEVDHLRTEKKSLMQQLLTGKRRVMA